MSDAAIERAYEQDLQAAARYLQVWVEYQDGRRVKVRTFMDTPEGRGVAAKCADEWFGLPDVEVQVVPIGAGSQVDRQVPQGTSAPAPSRATCCTPGMIAKPSGKRFCHSLDCPEQAGEPIPIARQHAQGRNWPPYNRERR